LAVAFDIDEGLRAKRSDGSAHPDAVMAVLLAQQQQMAEQRERWRQRARTVAQAAEAVDAHFSANRRSQP
jgi:argininosuccinate lyase